MVVWFLCCSRACILYVVYPGNSHTWICSRVKKKNETSFTLSFFCLTYTLTFLFICVVIKVGVLLLTVGLHAVTQFGLHLAVGPVAPLLGQLPRHGGGRHDRLRGRSLATTRDNQWMGGRQGEGKRTTDGRSHDTENKTKKKTGYGWIGGLCVGFVGHCMFVFPVFFKEKKKIVIQLGNLLTNQKPQGEQITCHICSSFCAFYWKSLPKKYILCLQRRVEPRLFMKNGRSHGLIAPTLKTQDWNIPYVDVWVELDLCNDWTDHPHTGKPTTLFS